jgi:hypothetical protein
MTEVSRRTFFGLLTAGAATAANFAYPGIANAAGGRVAGRRGVEGAPSGTTQTTVVGPVPGFAGGTVVAISDSGVVLNADGKISTVVIPAGTTVWKEFEVSPDQIEMGDWIDLKGEPQPDGSVRAVSGWTFVNIGRVNGRFVRVDQGQLTLDDDHGRSRAIELSTSYEVIHESDGSPVSNGANGIPPGAPMGAVGLRLPNGGFRATRIWHS